MERTVVLIGQCGIDGPRMEQMLGSMDDTLSVLSCNDQSELDEALSSGCDLMLINRELVGDFESDQGVDMIKSIRAKKPDLKVMLVSDYPDAQKEAVEAGAVKGFGKSDLGSDKVEKLLRQCLA
jgi:DNA-binding NarL/FixJ family response regulator